MMYKVYATYIGIFMQYIYIYICIYIYLYIYIYNMKWQTNKLKIFNNFTVPVAKQFSDYTDVILKTSGTKSIKYTS